MADGEETRRLARSYSARSEDAFHKLEVLAEMMSAKEKRFGELVAKCTKPISGSTAYEELVRVKNDLAMMVGEIDKLQMTGIDAVMVGELSTGKEEARASRKLLNKRAQTLSERIKELHASLVAHLESAAGK